jgi:spore maturation protein CgeB
MWFVENYRHLTYWQQLAAGYDFWFVMQKDPFEGALKRAGARQVQYLPLAADPLVHRPISLTPAEQEEVGADVSFLGAGYPNRRMLLPSLLNQEWSFKLWGNEWENPGPLESVLQRGGARINTELSVKIFNATRVNLNLHSFSGPGFDPDGDCVNPRTFELAACGSFQVVDHRTLLPDLFDPSMMGVIPHPDQLVPQVRRYLQEPETRTEMGCKAREHALRYHTYVHRMEALLGEVGVQSPDRIGAVLRGDRQAHGLIAKARASCPELVPMLKSFPPTQRVELEDVATAIRAKGPTAILNREELLVLMMDEYRQEKKDFV